MRMQCTYTVVNLLSIVSNVLYCTNVRTYVYTIGASARDIILVGGPSEREGFVQIYDGSSWDFLRPSTGFWTPTQAQVACNQLGYSGGSIPVLATEV